MDSTSVAVLLCTYNGAEYLRDQLDSIVGQDYPEVRIYASDDGSTDETTDILDEFVASLPEYLAPVRRGPGLGHCANFLTLLCAQDVKAGFYALSDQDDVWDCDKLSRAVELLSGIPEGVPAVYCGRTRTLDSKGNIGDLSPRYANPPAFANALVQNIAGGNTMVLNNAARSVVASAGLVDVPTHDWWVYILVSGVGGTVLYDSVPHLSYREHSGNLVGPALGYRARIDRFFAVLNGRNRGWNDRHIDALMSVRHLLEPGNSRLLEDFARVRRMGRWQQVKFVLSRSIYAQTPWGFLGLMAAALLKKI